MLVYVCAAALVSLFSAFLLLVNAPVGDEKPPGVAFSVFLALCCFEFCLGAYMPTVASVKAAWVPEDVRATVYGLFRVPLNLIVVIILLVSLSSATTFLICSCLLAVSLVAAVLARRAAVRRDQMAAAMGGLGGVGAAMATNTKNESTPLVSSNAHSSTC